MNTQNDDNTNLQKSTENFFLPWNVIRRFCNRLLDAKNNLIQLYMLHQDLKNRKI